MLRTIIWFTYFWLYLLVSIPKYFILASKENKDHLKVEFDYEIDKMAKQWSQSLVKLAGGRVQVKGAENIPKDEPVVFVANHQGNFDIPVLLGFIDKPKGFIAKKELKKMPLLGGWMRYVNCVFMDRSNPREALKAINQGAQMVKSGSSLVIFPEGTRSPDGTLGEFKQGSLKLALKAKATIIPVGINGTITMMKKGDKLIKPGHVVVNIGQPIRTADMSGSESKMVTELAKNAVAQLIQ